MRKAILFAALAAAACGAPINHGIDPGGGDGSLASTDLATTATGDLAVPAGSDLAVATNADLATTAPADLAAPDLAAAPMDLAFVAPDAAVDLAMSPPVDMSHGPDMGVAQPIVLQGTFVAGSAFGVAGGIELRAVLGWHVAVKGAAGNITLDGVLR